MKKNLIIIITTAFLISCSVSPRHAEINKQFSSIKITDGIDKAEAISMVQYYLYQTYQEHIYNLSEPNIKYGVDNKDWVISFMPNLSGPIYGYPNRNPLMQLTPLIVMINKNTGEFTKVVYTLNGNKIDVSTETIDLKNL